MKTLAAQPEQTSEKRSPFEKVGECLYRYTPNGTYYARVQKEGKEFRRSRKTTDRALAKRRLTDFQQEIGPTPPGANRVRSPSSRTARRKPRSTSRSARGNDKARIVRRIEQFWPGGRAQLLAKVRPTPDTPEER